MVRKTGLRMRRVARTLACLVVIVPGLAGLGLTDGCTEQRGSIGDQCLKSQDCVSGVCSGLVCVAPPPLLDAAYVQPGDAALDALQDGATSDVTAIVPDNDATTRTDAIEETGSPGPDVGPTGPGDVVEDVVDEVHPDAASPNGSPDARPADAGEAG